MIDIPRLTSEFVAKYGTMPRIFRAPGRINLIGEYTDMNDGYVLPAAINFATYVAAAPRVDRRIQAASLNFEHELLLDLDDAETYVDKGWTKFIRGAALTLKAAQFAVRGADLLIDSDIPVGAGLSSSAALEVSSLLALSSLSGHSIDKMDLAKFGQTVEHHYAGVQTGIMDQFASVFGVANHALFLDCRSLEWSPVPLSAAKFIICDTKIKHDLGSSEYNQRRAECEEAARFLGQSSLRDVSTDDLESRSADMPEIPKKRARHVLSENQRVLDSVAALRDHDLASLGRLINESHDSLRDDLEVSSDELDLMVNLARGQSSVIGSRMMGGGFGGCTINLVEPDEHREFIDKLSANYQRETGIIPDIYECETAGGACEIG